MAAIDFERAWLELKGYVVSRTSHGKRDLLSRMAEIEVDSRVPEGEEGFDPTPRSRPAVLRPVGGARHG